MTKILGLLSVLRQIENDKSQNEIIDFFTNEFEQPLYTANKIRGYSSSARPLFTNKLGLIVNIGI